MTKLSGEVHELDLYDLLRKGQPLLTPLSDGDTIYIPPLDGEVSINGEVKRPARYEVGANSTIADLIEMAGGPTERAYSRGLVLRRFDARRGAPSILQIDGFNSSLILKHGDSITVRSSSEQPNNPIKISGAVVQPGIYEYKPGLRVGDYLPSLEANYLLGSDLSLGVKGE